MTQAQSASSSQTFSSDLSEWRISQINWLEETGRVVCNEGSFSRFITFLVLFIFRELCVPSFTYAKRGAILLLRRAFSRGLSREMRSNPLNEKLVAFGIEVQFISHKDFLSRFSIRTQGYRPGIDIAKVGGLCRVGFDQLV